MDLSIEIEDGSKNMISPFMLPNLYASYTSERAMTQCSKPFRLFRSINQRWQILTCQMISNFM